MAPPVAEFGCSLHCRRHHFGGLRTDPQPHFVHIAASQVLVFATTAFADIFVAFVTS